MPETQSRTAVGHAFKKVLQEGACYNIHPMSGFQIVIAASYLLVRCFEFWLRFINLSHMKKHGSAVPPGFEGHVDEALLKKTHAYTIDTNTLDTVESLAGSAVILWFLFGGPLRAYSDWISGLSLSFVSKGVVYFLLLGLANTVLSVPFSLYGTFMIENRYGFNKTTPGLWLTDLIKSTVLSSVIMGLMLAGGFLIVLWSPDFWWLFVWGFLFVFSIIIMYVSPYVIEPLFNKFEPLEGEGTEERIKELMAGAGLKISRVFRMDASRRSRHSNAYFTGIGKVKRIVLYDTLLERMAEGEMLAVLAHEAGHWKKRHLLKMIAIFEALSLVGLYISFLILKGDSLSNAFGISGDTFLPKLLILGLISSIITFPLTPLLSALSRRHENEADRFAIGLTGRAEDLAVSLIKLSKDNLANLHPHPLYARFYYTHPPVVERVRSLRSYRDALM